jgi:hypothetical protein
MKNTGLKNISGGCQCRDGSDSASETETLQILLNSSMIGDLSMALAQKVVVQHSP